MMQKNDALVGGLALVLVTLSGCSTGHKERGPGTDNTRYTEDLHELSTTTQLEVLGEREAMRPSAVDRGLVQELMGGAIEELRAGTPQHTKAFEPTEEVLGRVIEGLEDIEHAEITLHPQVGKGYARARAAMMNGDYADAVATYERLAEVAPKSMAIQVGLGDAYQRAGSRTEAVEAYGRAVELGDDSTRTLVYAAMGMTDDPGRVIELCSRVWTDETGGDRAGRVLGGVMLGRALLEDGSTVAGAEVLGEAMGMLDAQTARDPKYRRELVQLYTSRGEQYAAVGDAWIILDQPDRALAEYERAGAAVSGTPNALVARQMAAHLLAGHSAQAAMTLLDSIDMNPGDDSTGAHRLVGLIGQHEVVGEMVLGSLRDRLLNKSHSVASRRVVLGLMLSMIEGSENDGAAAVDLLVDVSRSDSGVLSPVAGARVLSLFEEWERLGMVVDLVERAPAAGVVLVPALVRLDGRGRELFDGVEGDSVGAALTRCLIALDLGRVDWLDAVEANNPEGRSTSWLIAHARAAVLDADWGVADRLFERCASRVEGMDGGELFFYADSLVTANRIDEAKRLGEQISTDEDASAADLMVRVRIAMMIGGSQQAQIALETLSRALELEEFDEAIYEKLITLRGPTGAGADVDELRRVTRMLSQNLPGSALVGLIRAHEIAGSAASDEGNPAMLAQAERLLVGLHDRHAWREIGLDLLLSVWATQYTMGDSGAIERGLGWVDGRMASMPGSVDLVGAYARLLVLDGRVEEAEAFLHGVSERMPGRGFERLEEGLIRSDTDRRIEGDELVLGRLEGLVSVEDCLERIERAAATGRLVEFDLELLVPAGSWVYRDSQALRIARVLGAVIESGADSVTTDRVLEIIERTRGRIGSFSDEGVSPSFALDQIEVVAMPTASGFSMDRYEQLVRRLRDARGEDGLQIVTIAMQSLIRDSASRALDLLGRLSVDDAGGLDEQMVNDLASLLGQMGTAEDVKSAIGRLESGGVLIEARDVVVGSLGTLGEDSRAPSDAIDSVAADLIYSIAVVASFYERDDARAMYRLALLRDADHAWANNDLGYGMVEDGLDLDEAERLLVKAHEAAPGKASITDSLAWARYVMGVFEDELDGAGNVTRRGAKGLLEEALSLEDGTDNATIFDHLGDALWMLGEFEAAVVAWLDAEDLLRERLTELSNEENVNARAIERLREELSTIRFKISDGESGRVPAVAGTAAGIEVPVPGENNRVDEIDPQRIDPEK